MTAIDNCHAVARGDTARTPAGAPDHVKRLATPVFTDSGVENCEELIAALGETSEWRLIDAQRDGVAQIAAALAEAIGTPVAAASAPVGYAELGGTWRFDVGESLAAALDLSQWRGLLGLSVTPKPLASQERSGGEWRNGSAFAGLRSDGSVVIWGDPAFVGNSSAFAPRRSMKFS